MSPRFSEESMPRYAVEYVLPETSKKEYPILNKSRPEHKDTLGEISYVTTGLTEIPAMKVLAEPPAAKISDRFRLPSAHTAREFQERHLYRAYGLSPAVKRLAEEVDFVSIMLFFDDTDFSPSPAATPRESRTPAIHLSPRQ